MISHDYQLSGKDLLQLLGGPLLPVIGFALLMHWGQLAGWLPSPLPALDIDRTILLHQAAASRSELDADLILVGDSSCLMDVDAPGLEQALPDSFKVWNLGTLSYLDLSAFGSLLEHYIDANPGRLRTVILLMHPEAVRRLEPVPYHKNLLREFYHPQDRSTQTPRSPMTWLGVTPFKERILSRMLPRPLGGAYGWKYGFTTDLWRYLSLHQGSAVDPRSFDPQTAEGNAEYRLPESLRQASQEFRRLLPRGTGLAVGITPVPESFALPGYEERHREMLQQWSDWLQAEIPLGLPATMPDHYFAGVTHLNQAGNRHYTRLLAEELAGRLQP